MAGEWINRDTGLRSHPAILHLWLHFEKKHHKGLLADCVCEMWAYADQFGHVDGDDILCDLTPELLDAHVDVPGFTDALLRFRENRMDKKPWVVVEGDRLRFPSLYAVMDSSSKRRAENREKRKRERAASKKRKQDVGQVSHDKAPTVGPVSHDNRPTAPPQQTTDNRTQITDNRELEHKDTNAFARAGAAIPGSTVASLGLHEPVWAAWTKGGILPATDKRPAVIQIGHAIGLVALREPHCQQQGRAALESAAAWLASRVDRWRESPLVRSKTLGWNKHAAGWFDAGRYDDDDSAWNRTEDRNDRGDKPTAAQRADAGKFRHEG